MPIFENIADLINPETGKTYRQDNNARKHKYAAGQPVKLDSGSWANITKLTRDCDGTPLYSYELSGLGEDSIIDSLPLALKEDYMSRKYTDTASVPTETLANRLDELANAITKGREASDREFTMRIPAECDRDADLVLSEAAKRLRGLNQ